MNVRGYIGASVLVVAVGAGGLFALPAAHAQTAPVCVTDEQKAACQAQYDELQKEIAQYQQIIDQTKAQEASLKGDVTQLNAQIAKAQAEIKQRNVVIGQLSTQIQQKTATVQTLEQRLTASQESVAKLLREKYEQDNTPLAVLALSSGSLSDFFTQVNDVNMLDASLQEHMQELQGIKTQTQAEADALSKQQDAQKDARYTAQVLQQQVSQTKQQKTQLLTATKGQEAQYQKVLAQRQAAAAALKAALFPLRDAASITFGTALTYAQAAEGATGVDPALVLAILTQESNLGANVGQCFLANDETGAGVNKKTGNPMSKVMNPTRDVPLFLALGNQLGFDPHGQVVSCPIPSAGGWGGAMGPAQFIPSTWKLYAARVASANGKGIANPWDPKDAITAMAFLLEDNGAAAGGYSAEHRAAAKYYAGAAWATAGTTYANQVMARVSSIQTEIDCINDNSSCSLGN